MMPRYLVLMEPTGTGYSAYSPDLPGCVSTGPDRAAVEANMREAMQFHIDGLREDGEPVPAPVSVASYVSVDA
jgi:predicted RNase H-like HicB family nuclease